MLPALELEQQACIERRGLLFWVVRRFSVDLDAKGPVETMAQA